MASGTVRIRATNMKKITKIWIGTMIAASFQLHAAFAQSFDDARMTKDIEVAENVLATLIKHEMSSDRTIFGLDIRGSYQPGYGVTFRLPPDQSMPFAISIRGDDVQGATVISDGNTYRYSFRTNGSRNVAPEDDNSIKLKERSEISADSLRAVYNQKMIKAAQDFILDYGDLISQLGASEKIVVTNQSDRPHFYFNAGQRTRIVVEGTRQDVTALREGKITREQALKRLTIVNTEALEAREPDMEMLSSIFSRLYRPDLSKTYFIQGNVYYERLRDFGAIFYMQMVSSTETGFNRHTLPTLALENLDQATRDKKVAELYPAFEQDVKDNILEYGRTLKSLKDDESLIFNISLTKCQGCGIPGTLEIAIKSSILKEFGAGKLDRAAAMGKFIVKKGMNQ
jgi:hypothetical protein